MENDNTRNHKHHHDPVKHKRPRPKPGIGKPHIQGSSSVIRRHNRPQVKKAVKLHAERQAHDDLKQQDHHTQDHMNQSQPKHSHHDHGTMISDYRRRFWISLILSIPVIILSPMVQHILGYDFTFMGSQYVVFILATVIYLYGGWPFLKGFVDEMKARSAGMMTLIALAISVAWIYSTAVVFGLNGMDFYWELATLIDIMLLGHLLEMKSLKGASRALELLVNMMPADAWKITTGEPVKVRIENLRKGDLILIRPGEKVPADGRVIEGESYLDESMLTGESKPVKKSRKDTVIGGSVNGNGSLKVRVRHLGKDSYLNKVIHLVEEAQKTKSATQALADKAAKWLTYVSLSLGIITLVVWLASGAKLDFAIERMVTVMVISCPHALGLAVPLVVSISTSMAANRGLLIRNRTAFENARKITMVIFDKTGTLTEGSHQVTSVVSFDKKYDEKELIRLSAGVEQNSEHYIAQGILRKAREYRLKVPPTDRFNYVPGKGLEGMIEGIDVKVVGPNYLKDYQIEIPAHEAEEGIETVVYVLVEGRPAGYISLRDKIRLESERAIAVLKSGGIKNLLLTGDNERVAENVSKILKMDGFIANVLPHEKQERIKEMQQKGEYVAMTGDGVNDAPALAQADVGIAVGSGTDVAAETADIILVNSNPEDIASLILFGRATYRKMMQNLGWAIGYNIIALPLAAGILYNQGIMISPALGAILMSVSTIVVALNAQLLRRSIR